FRLFGSGPDQKQCPVSTTDAPVLELLLHKLDGPCSGSYAISLRVRTTPIQVEVNFDRKNRMIQIVSNNAGAFRPQAACQSTLRTAQLVPLRRRMLDHESSFASLSSDSKMIRRDFSISLLELSSFLVEELHLKFFMLAKS